MCKYFRYQKEKTKMNEISKMIKEFSTLVNENDPSLTVKELNNKIEKIIDYLSNMPFVPCTKNEFIQFVDKIFRTKICSTWRIHLTSIGRTSNHKY